MSPTPSADIEQRNGLPPRRPARQAHRPGRDLLHPDRRKSVASSAGPVCCGRNSPNAAASGESEISEQEKLLKAQQGQSQYRHGRDLRPRRGPLARPRCAAFRRHGHYGELRAGAPFGIVAAEFSQSPTALQGGDAGWMRPDQLDPQVAALVSQMPVGAISNPIRVAGGFDVVTVREKRTVGSDLATVLNLRQAFFPFTSTLDPQNPTDQQKKALKEGEDFSRTASSCDAVDAENKVQGAKRPSDPGEVRLDHLSQQMQTLLGALQPGHASKALVTPDGIMVVMVCSRAEKNLAAMSRDDIGNQLLEERVELASRQLQQDIRRRALIDQRSS